MGNQALSSAITKKYAVDPATPVASAGPLGLWSVYSATIRSTAKDKKSPRNNSIGGDSGDCGDEVSLWVLRKADATRIDHPSVTKLKPKEQARSVQAHLTAGAKTLSRLRHPSLLRVVEVLPDSNSHIAVITEPVFASLANALKRYDGPAFAPPDVAKSSSDAQIAQGPPAELREFSMSEFEVCHGMHQISEALRFLHEEAKLVHGNVCPSSVVLTSGGDWKLCGFGFAQQGIGGGDFAKATMFTQEACEEDNAATRQHAPPQVPLRPTVNYAAPEICDVSVTRRECSHASDVFSLACLLWELTVGMQSQDGSARPLLQGRDGRVSTHRYKLSQLNPDQVITSAGSSMPEGLKETLRGMLQIDPRRRPNMQQVCICPYFDSGSVKVLKIVSSLTASETTAARQAQILAHLPKQLARFPARVIRDRVLPTLVTMCAARSQTTPFVLPSLLFSARKLSRGEFDRNLAPVFRALVNDLPKMAAQCTLILVENVQILLDQGSRLFTQNVVVPMVVSALRGGNNMDQNNVRPSSRGQYYSYGSSQSNSLQSFTAADASRIRLAALAKVDAVADVSPGHTFQKSIFPTIGALLLEQDAAVVAAALDAVCASFQRLEGDMVMSLVLPAVEACIKKQFQNGELCVHVAKTYQALAEHLGAKCAAQKILPVVVRLLAEKHFTDEQFIQYVACVQGIVERIKTVRLGGVDDQADRGDVRNGALGSIVTDGAMPNLDFAVAAAAQVASVSIDDSEQNASFVKKELTMPPPQQQRTRISASESMGSTTMGSFGGGYAMMEDSSTGDLLSLDMTPPPGGAQTRGTMNASSGGATSSGHWSSMGGSLPFDPIGQQQPPQSRRSSSNSMASLGVGMGGKGPIESRPSMGGLHVSGQGSDYGSLAGSDQGQKHVQSYDPYGGLTEMGGGMGANSGGAYNAPVMQMQQQVQQQVQQQPLFSRPPGASQHHQMQQHQQMQHQQTQQGKDLSRGSSLDLFAGLSGIPSSQPTLQKSQQQVKPRASTSSSISGFDFM